MRNHLLSVFLMAILCSIGCSDTPKHTIVDEKISLKKLQEDFRYFRLILEAVHPGLYQYTPEKEMNRSFDSVYQSLTEATTLIDFYNRLSPIVNSIHCGHSNILLTKTLLDTAYKIVGYFPIPLNVVNHQLVVNSTEFNIPVGAEILSINNEAVSAFFPALCMYEPVDGFNIRYQQEEVAWDFARNYFLYRGPQRSFTVGYKIDSIPAIQQTVVAAQTYSNTLLNGRNFGLPEDVNYNLQLVDAGGYAILTIYTFGYDSWSTDEAFENFITNSFRLLQKTPNIRNLIIDIRNNTGGNFHNMFHLYGHLTHLPQWKEFKSAYTIFNRIPFTPYLAKAENNTTVLQATLDSTFGGIKNGRSVKQYRDNETMYPQSPIYNGHIFVLTNSNVQSAAAYFAALLKDEGVAKIVGVETGGSGANTNSFHLLTYELPHTKLQLSVPVVHAEYSLQNNKHKLGHGVIPDYPVSLSLAGLVENADNQLIYILDSLIR